MLDELKKYRACGIVLLIMNLALTLIIFFMVHENRTFHHHEITTIALAAYTFTSLTIAIINTVKYRRYNSPVYSAAKAISLASATVSLLTLESSMLTTFNSGALENEETIEKKLEAILLGNSSSDILIKTVLERITVYRDHRIVLRLCGLPQVFWFSW